MNGELPLVMPDAEYARRGASYRTPLKGRRRLCRRAGWWLLALLLVGVSAPALAGLQPLSAALSLPSALAPPSLGTVLTTITVGEQPTFIALAPGGNRVFVLNALARTISVVDPVTDQVRATLATTPLSRATSLAVTPDGTTLVVLGSLPDTSGQALLLDASTGALLGVVSLGQIPLRVVLSADGTRAFVTSSAAGRLEIIDLASRQVVQQVLIGAQPHSLSLAPDGQRVYIVQAVARRLTVVDVASGQVVGQLVLPALTRLTGISLSADGRQAYVVDGINEALWVVDLNDLMVLGGIQLGVYPFALSQVGSDGLLYVAHRSEPGVLGQVSVIQTPARSALERPAAP
ncbi:MAG: hypothetical protein HY335_10300, partial [Deinococcus sp.]|nr:hypothetical protein [Deinococcus sp.]